jgi:hypothetical protein
MQCDVNGSAATLVEWAHAVLEPATLKPYERARGLRSTGIGRGWTVHIGTMVHGYHLRHRVCGLGWRRRAQDIR